MQIIHSLQYEGLSFIALHSGKNKEIKCLKYYHQILYMVIETEGNHVLE